MTDTSTQKPLRVSDIGTPWSSLMLPFTQVEEVRRLLDGRDVRYWVEANVISLNGGPEIATIQFGRGGDGAAIQALLDGSDCASA